MCHLRVVRGQVVAFDIRSISQQRFDLILVLGGRDRAGRVDQDAAGAQALQGRVDQLALEGRELRHLLRRLAPAHVRPGLEGPQVGAGRVQQDAVVGAGGRLASVDGRDAHVRRPHARHVDAQRLGPLRVALDGRDLALAAHERRQVRGLGARCGGHVEHPVPGPGVEHARHRHRPARLRDQRPAGELGGPVGVPGLVDHEPLGQAWRGVRRAHRSRSPARRGW